MKAGITPNQYYILHSISENVSSKYITNEIVELKILINNNFLDTNYKLTEKSIKIIELTEKFFSTSYKKVLKKSLGNAFKENLKKFNTLFPKKRLSSGRPARSAMSNLEPCFIWFFSKNDYSWETIFKATEMYLEKMDYGNNKYTSCSHYFVRKQNTADRTFNSILADYCELIEGGFEKEEVHFKEKTFNA